MFLTRHRTTPRPSGTPHLRTTTLTATLLVAGALVTGPTIAAGLSASATPKPGTNAALASATITPNTGRLLASNCYQCHGTNGSGGFEHLAGESASEIYGELKEFAANTSSNNIMAAHAAGYTDAQMRAIAAYLSTVR